MTRHESRMWAAANRDDVAYDLRYQLGHETIDWDAEHNLWVGTCADCGAVVVVSASHTSSRGARDARYERCEPGTAILTEIETMRLHELANQAIRTYLDEIGETP